MVRRSREQEYEQTGMTNDQRDLIIWELRTKHHLTPARIAKRVHVTPGVVNASLRRTEKRRAGLLP